MQKHRLLLPFFLLFRLFLNAQNITTLDNKNDLYYELQKQGIKIEYSDNEFALAKKGDKYGIVKGLSIIIPFDYDAILTFFKNNSNIAIVRKENKFFLINKNNEKISNSYDYVYGPYQEKLYSVKLNGKYSFIDSNGKELFGWYDNDLSFIDDYCVVSINNKFGLIDTNGNTIIPILYDNIKNEIRQNQVIAKKEKYGIINLSKKIIIPFQYDEIDFSNKNGDFTNEYYIKAEGKTGIINGLNEVIIQPIYDKIFESENGYRKAVKGNFLGLLNENGKIIIPFEYNGLYKFDNKERLRVSKEKLWGIIDFNNKIIIPMIYPKISKNSFEKNNEYSKSEFIYKVSLDGDNYIIIDENNKIIRK